MARPWHTCAPGAVALAKGPGLQRGAAQNEHYTLKENFSKKNLLDTACVLATEVRGFGLNHGAEVVKKNVAKLKSQYQRYDSGTSISRLL